jgi:crossover junction endodeoxyribonuclease RuvC
VRIVVIEDVHSMRGQGVASTFKFGRAFGAVEGVVGALDYPHVRVTPLRWKRRMGVTADKESSRAKAIELWPKARADFARKASGRAEAALIARWWIERNGS